MTATRASGAREDVVLALSDITKRFGATVALRNVGFVLRRGTVHALVGENGAGKTTLMRVAFGMLAPDSGAIQIAGAERRITSPADAIRAGVGMVHQHFTNVPAMSVAENVALGGHGRFDAQRAAATVVAIGARTGLELDPSARADTLPVGAQQRLEIVKALARDAKILILDEPTAVLAPAKADELLRWLRAFADAGNAVVLITHKLREAFSIADDITVLRRGNGVLTAATRDVTVDSIAAALLGEELAPPTSGASGGATPGAIVAHLDHVDVLDDRGGGAVAVRDATLTVHAGEILGVAAVEGAGHRELLRAIATRIAIAAGSSRLPEKIGFIPEDRQHDALVLEHTAAENVVLRGAGARRGRIQWDVERAHAARLVDEYDVRGAGARQPVRALSGGNQQKLVLARELDGSPALLVAENPTRGLDIRATRDVHERLRNAAASGAAVVLYSSDLDEVLSLATRVIVMHAGRLREVPLDRDAVGRAMLGVA